MSDGPVYEIPLEPPVPGRGEQPVPPGFVPTPLSAYGPPPGASAPPPVPPSLATAPPPRVADAPAPPGAAPAFGFDFPPPATPAPQPAAPSFEPGPAAGSVPFPTAEDAGGAPTAQDPPPFPFPFTGEPSPDAGAVPFPTGDAPTFAAPPAGSSPMPSLDDLIAAATEREPIGSTDGPSFAFGPPEAAAPVQTAADLAEMFAALATEAEGGAPESAPFPAASAAAASETPSWAMPPAEPRFEPPIEVEALAGPIPVAAVDEAVLGTLPEALRSVDADLIAALRSVGPSRASDLHITAGSPPTLRVDGSLRALDMATWDADKTSAALLSALSSARLEQFEREHELDWALTISPTERFRVNYSIQRGTVAAAFRIIPTRIKSLRELGMPDVVARFAGLPRGLVLVTGPTGSGKSTTLAALIDLVNQTRADHIVTVEDPIEYLHTSKKALVKQREVGADTHSFSQALKHVLRQDPDVILVGEMRDLETISVALTAAETGHLVFATLHTQDAAQTIDRVIDVFPPHQQNQVRAQLSVTLQGVVCQTLVRNASGSGRSVATEVMFVTPAIANVVREGKTYQVPSMMQAGREQGMHTMDQALADLVNDGTVTHDAALERVHDEETFGRLVRRRQGL